MNRVLPYSLTNSTSHLGRYEEMGTETEELISVLDQLALLLESDGEAHWSMWVRKIRIRLLDADEFAVEHLRAAYGGMGSLNDLVLGQSQVDGVFCWKPGYIELNEKFSDLRAKAAKLADSLRRSITAPENLSTRVPQAIA